MPIYKSDVIIIDGCLFLDKRIFIDTYLSGNYVFHWSNWSKINLEKTKQIDAYLSGLHVARDEDQRSEERGGEPVHVERGDIQTELHRHGQRQRQPQGAAETRRQPRGEEEEETRRVRVLLLQDHQ